MADYFSEIMHALRKSHSQHNIVNNRLVLKNANIRDEKSIRKITAGLLKLIYPNDQVEDEYFEEIVKYAVGLRQSVVDQNYYLTKKEDYNVKIEWEVISE